MIPVLKLLALTKTCIACPSQWEGTLEDGRTIYARYRYGELSVGVGNDINEAVRNGMSDQAIYADCVGDGLDGFMDVQELKVHLHELLEFPADLIVEHDDQPSSNPDTLIEGSPCRDLGVDDPDEIWAKVTPAPEDEGLELAGDELRTMRGECRGKDDL